MEKQWMTDTEKIRELEEIAAKQGKAIVLLSEAVQRLACHIEASSISLSSVTAKKTDWIDANASAISMEGIWRAAQSAKSQATRGDS
jgi:uncharacterized coiled-coil protein SlyX